MVDSKKENSFHTCKTIMAGNIKETAAATPSPAEAAVWIILHSKMLDRLKNFKMLIAKTEAGIEAEMVAPIFKAK
jgi:hypothetical protein